MEGVKERPAFQVASGQLVVDGGTVHDRLSTMNPIRSDKMIQNQYAQECGRNTKKNRHVARCTPSLHAIASSSDANDDTRATVDIVRII